MRQTFYISHRRQVELGLDSIPSEIIERSVTHIRKHEDAMTVVYRGLIKVQGVTIVVESSEDGEFDIDIYSTRQLIRQNK